MKTVWIKYSLDSEHFNIYSENPDKPIITHKQYLIISEEGASLLFGKIDKKDCSDKAIEVIIMKKEEKQKIPSNKIMRRAYMSGALYMAESNGEGDK